MKQIKINPANISYDEFYRIAQQCGFIIKEGRKHCKVLNQEGKFITTIPRHNQLKRETARGIAKKFIEFGADIIIV